MNNGPLKITSGPFDADAFDSSHSLQDEELKVKLSWLAMNIITLALTVKILFYYNVTNLVPLLHTEYWYITREIALQIIDPVLE